jgi:predicted GIY-YIG superfamily endonuclease
MNGYYYVYLLRCADGKVYTGCTGSLKKRLNEHEKGQVDFTSTRLPFELITCIAFKEKHKAFAFEKYLKSGSGKAFAQKRLL